VLESFVLKPIHYCISLGADFINVVMKV